MVNACCVKGCGRTSKLSAHLNYYTLPKEKHRRIQWLKAAGREDLLNARAKTTYRFCSRHFSVSSVKNKNLLSDAVPTLWLPGEGTASITVEAPHHDIVCNNCNNHIMGFRYKCVTCADYDLCSKCEMLDIHANHYMLRIPKPLKFKIADNLIQKWRQFFKAEHVNPDCDIVDHSDCSSDDEPISKHAKKQYDSGVDLSEDVKDMIRQEVTRVLTLKPEDKRKRKKDKKRMGGDSSLLYKALNKNSTSKRPRLDKSKDTSDVEETEVEVPPDTPVPATPALPETPAVPAPEVAFADVNEYKEQVDVKNEVLPATSTGEETLFGQPLMHVRLSDDLTELMIEMSKNGENTIYKYN